MVSALEAKLVSISIGKMIFAGKRGSLTATVGAAAGPGAVLALLCVEQSHADHAPSIAGGTNSAAMATVARIGHPGHLEPKHALRPRRYPSLGRAISPRERSSSPRSSAR